MLAVSEGHRISGQPNRVGGGRRFSASAAGQSINNSNRSGSAAIPGGGSNLDASSKLTDYSNSIREGGGADGLDVSSKLSESFSTRDGGSRSGGTTSSKSGTFIIILICVADCGRAADLIRGWRGYLIGWRRGFGDGEVLY